MRAQLGTGLSWTVQCGVIFGVSRFDGPSLCFIAAFRSNYKSPQLSVPHSTASSFMKGEMWLRSALRPASWCLVTIAEWPQQIKMSRGFIFYLLIQSAVWLSPASLYISRHQERRYDWVKLSITSWWRRQWVRRGGQAPAISITPSIIERNDNGAPSVLLLFIHTVRGSNVYQYLISASAPRWHRCTHTDIPWPSNQPQYSYFVTKQSPGEVASGVHIHIRNQRVNDHQVIITNNKTLEKEYINTYLNILKLKTG